MISDWTETLVPVGQLVDSPALNEEYHKEKIERYANRMRRRLPLDPVEIIGSNEIGGPELYEGHHRIFAAQKAKVPFVYVIEEEEER